MYECSAYWNPALPTRDAYLVAAIQASRYLRYSWSRWFLTDVTVNPRKIGFEEERGCFSNHPCSSLADFSPLDDLHGET